MIYVRDALYVTKIGKKKKKKKRERVHSGTNCPGI